MLSSYIVSAVLFAVSALVGLFMFTCFTKKGTEFTTAFINAADTAYTALSGAYMAYYHEDAPPYLDISDTVTTLDVKNDHAEDHYYYGI